MTKSELALFTANLFTSSAMSNDQHVVERHVPMMVDHYHQCLLRRTKPLSFVNNVLGLSRSIIDEFKIGFCDRSLPSKLPYHKSAEGKKLRGGFQRVGLMGGIAAHETMRGCVTLPLINEDGLAGVYGLRYGRPQRNVSELKCSVFGHMPGFAPEPVNKLALLSETPFSALGLRERGYRNALSILGDGFCEITSIEMKKMGIESLVLFTDATNDEASLIEFKNDVRAAEFELIEVPLPFKVLNIGKWDECQWRLFDKRLTRLLTEAGHRNERYQA